ncbi:transposase [Streptococcus pneumoniae]|nr:transposase [Streptococcus pneumoniae]
MTKKVGVGQAHSKIILIGEHAVVYGYPAISLPLLEVEVTCKVVPAESPWRLYEEDTLSMAVYASLEYLDITHAMKAQAIVTSQGRIVSLDITVNYCHDMKLFKMSRRNIGQAGKILADSGYQGLMKIYPQAQTPRKSSKLKPLIAEDKAYNHALSKDRSKVENILAKVKTFKMISTTYRNHRKRFGLRMNLIAGIINHELGF